MYSAVSTVWSGLTKLMRKHTLILSLKQQFMNAQQIISYKTID